MTSDDTEQSDSTRDTDKLLRNRNSSRFGSRFGKYFGKLSKSTKHKEASKANEDEKDSAVKKGDINDSAFTKNETRNTAVKKGESGNAAWKRNEPRDIALKKNEARKGKNYTKKRADGNMNGKLQSSSQDKGQIAKEGKKGRNVSAALGKSRSLTPELDSDFEEKEQRLKRGAGDRRSANSVEANGRLRKNPSVTFSPTVTCTSDSAHTAQKTKNPTNKRMLTPVHLPKRHVIASETSDTDSTTQELHTVCQFNLNVNNFLTQIEYNKLNVVSLKLNVKSAQI